MLERCVGVSQEMQANDARNRGESTEEKKPDYCDFLRPSHLQLPNVVYWK